MAESGKGALSGVRVVELGTLIAGPFAARLLAEFGAEVIKIEQPESGDPLRKWRRLHKNTSLWWYLQSRNKKSVTVDMRREEGQEIVRRLLKDADILIENFRPGTLEKWGLGPDDLLKENPGLVIVRISGFGQNGPYAARPGFGSVGEALGGIRYTTGESGGAPVRAGISLGDSVASLHAVMGALVGLHRVRSGKGGGQVVDVSLVESVFNLMESTLPEFSLYGDVRERTGSRLPGIVPSGTYKSADGAWIVVAGNGDSIFRRLMTAIGRDDLGADPALQTNDQRVAQEALLESAIAQWVAAHPAAHVLATLEAADVPVSRIYSIADIAQDPQFRARGVLAPATLPDGTEVLMPGIVPQLSQTPGRVNWLGPQLGAHTEDVVEALGYDAVTRARLREAGVI
jgi:crotonobetainyl-CoA:carnitine CoA-transferase CaiB-like acyl-CoA transferase